MAAVYKVYFHRDITVIKIFLFLCRESFFVRSNSDIFSVSFIWSAPLYKNATHSATSGFLLFCDSFTHRQKRATIRNYILLLAVVSAVKMFTNRKLKMFSPVFIPHRYSKKIEKICKLLSIKVKVIIKGKHLKKKLIFTIICVTRR